MRPTHSRKPHTTFAIPVFAGLVLSACSNDLLPDRYALGGLRVLALIADKPEAAPGTGVTITPLITDLDGDGRSISYSFEACVDPGVAQGVLPSCATAATKESGSGSFSFAGGDTKRTGAATGFAVTVPATILTGQSTINQTNGVAYLVTYTITAGSSSATSFRRVIATTRTSLNNNPTVTAILTSAGASVSTVPATDTTLKTTVGTGTAGAETYSALTTQGNTTTATESLTVSWYTSVGDYKYSRTTDTGTNPFTAPTTSSTKTPFFFLVIRDDRGGVGFLSL